MRYLLLLVVALVLGCGAATPAASEPGQFNAVGLKLIIGVERTKTLEVKPNGSVVNSETGDATMTFVGTELRLADGSKTILALDGDTLRGATKTMGAFEGETLALGEGDIRMTVKNDGAVYLSHAGSERKMRMHFDGSVVGRKRAALMLVAVVFALYVATHPTASLDRFVDD
jgi:hypothetical protein